MGRVQSATAGEICSLEDLDVCNMMEKERFLTLHYTARVWDGTGQFPEPVLYEPDNHLLYSIRVGKLTDEEVADFLQSADIESKPRFYHEKGRFYPCAFTLHSVDTETPEQRQARRIAMVKYKRDDRYMRDYRSSYDNVVRLFDEPKLEWEILAPSLLVKASMVGTSIRRERKRGQDNGKSKKTQTKMSPQTAKSGKERGRPESPRAETFLKWDAEGTKPAAIRDRWNELSHSEKMKIDPKNPSRYDDLKKGRDEIRKLIERRQESPTLSR